MKNFDELIKMNEDELLQYLEQQVEKVITNAQPHNQLKLRALQSKIDGIRKKYHGAPNRKELIMADIQDMMIRSFLELNLKLQQFRSN